MGKDVNWVIFLEALVIIQFIIVTLPITESAVYFPYNGVFFVCVCVWGFVKWRKEIEAKLFHSDEPSPWRLAPTRIDEPHIFLPAYTIATCLTHLDLTQPIPTCPYPFRNPPPLLHQGFPGYLSRGHYEATFLGIFRRDFFSECPPVSSPAKQSPANTTESPAIVGQMR